MLRNKIKNRSKKNIRLNNSNDKFDLRNKKHTFYWQWGAVIFAIVNIIFGYSNYKSDKDLKASELKLKNNQYLDKQFEQFQENILINENIDAFLDLYLFYDYIDTKGIHRYRSKCTKIIAKVITLVVWSEKSALINKALSMCSEDVYKEVLYINSGLTEEFSNEAINIHPMLLGTMMVKLSEDFPDNQILSSYLLEITTKRLLELDSHEIEEYEMNEKDELNILILYSYAKAIFKTSEIIMKNPKVILSVPLRCMFINFNVPLPNNEDLPKDNKYIYWINARFIGGAFAYQDISKGINFEPESIADMYFTNSIFYDMIIFYGKSRIMFKDCDLVKIDFNKSDLSNTLFNNCNFSETDFSESNVNGTAFYNYTGLTNDQIGILSSKGALLAGCTEKINAKIISNDFDIEDIKKYRPEW